MFKYPYATKRVGFFVTIPVTNQLGTMLNHSLQGVIMPNNKPLLGMIYYWAYRIIVLLRPRWVHGGDYLGYNPFE